MSTFDHIKQAYVTDAGGVIESCLSSCLLAVVHRRLIMAENDESRIKGLFDKYKDSNGRLDKDGLTTMIKNDFKGEIDLDDNQIETILMLLDQDGLGSVSFEQFYKWYCRDNKLVNIQDSFRCRMIQKAIQKFKEFDTNKNGTIERDELQHLLQSLSFDVKLQENAFEELDKDKNGKISFPEFLTWLHWLPSLD